MSYLSLLVGCAGRAGPARGEASIIIDGTTVLAAGLFGECVIVVRGYSPKLGLFNWTVDVDGQPIGFYLSSNPEPDGMVRLAVNLTEPVPPGLVTITLTNNYQPLVPRSAAALCTVAETRASE
jgi:hypothetical protein